MEENTPLPPLPRMPVSPTLFKRGETYYCHVRPPYWIRLGTGRESMRISLHTKDEETARDRLALVADAYSIFFGVICFAPCDSFHDLKFEATYTEFRRYLGSSLRFYHTEHTAI